MVLRSLVSLAFPELMYLPHWKLSERNAWDFSIVFPAQEQAKELNRSKEISRISVYYCPSLQVTLSLYMKLPVGSLIHSEKSRGKTGHMCKDLLPEPHAHLLTPLGQLYYPFSGKMLRAKNRVEEGSWKRHHFRLDKSL